MTGVSQGILKDSSEKGKRKDTLTTMGYSQKQNKSMEESFILPTTIYKKWSGDGVDPYSIGIQIQRSTHPPYILDFLGMKKERKRKDFIKKRLNCNCSTIKK